MAMTMSGEVQLNAPRAEVYKKLNDPEVLKACIPGCEQLDKLSGEGEGGVAGFAKGGASVALTDKDGGTLLTYNVEAQIGGKLAQLGQRLIAGAAKKMADEFFEKFAQTVSAPA